MLCRVQLFTFHVFVVRITSSEKDEKSFRKLLTFHSSESFLCLRATSGANAETSLSDTHTMAKFNYRARQIKCGQNNRVINLFSFPTLNNTAQHTDTTSTHAFARTTPRSSEFHSFLRWFRWDFGSFIHYGIRPALALAHASQKLIKIKIISSRSFAIRCVPGS